mmetsp:Transcript_109494/g.353426  ORF Transcript_109494/g.353426 Transcript_109494/m.353426 type:complete len:197 (+) Transcript_109494:126-716(+)
MRLMRSVVLLFSAPAFIFDASAAAETARSCVAGQEFCSSDAAGEDVDVIGALQVAKSTQKMLTAELGAEGAPACLELVEANLEILFREWGLFDEAYLTLRRRVQSDIHKRPADSGTDASRSQWIDARGIPETSGIPLSGARESERHSRVEPSHEGCLDRECDGLPCDASATGPLPVFWLCWFPRGDGNLAVDRERG